MNDLYDDMKITKMTNRTKNARNRTTGHKLVGKAKTH